QGLAVRMHTHGEGQPQQHAGGIGTQRAVDRLLQLGKGYNRVEPLSDLVTRETSNDAGDEDILAPGEIQMKAHSQIEQRADSPVHLPAPLVSAPDAPNESPQRRLPSPTAT